MLSRRSQRQALVAGVPLLFGCLLLLPLFAGGWLVWRSRQRISRGAATAPAATVGIVFGAGVRPDGTVSPMLADRVATGVELLRAGKVGRLVLSGGPEEPGPMAAWARRLGAPAHLLELDPAGLRTACSCQQAAAAGVRECLLVTHGYHLPRALWLADQAGLQAWGVAADRSGFQHRWWHLGREAMAQVLALGQFRPGG